jgi:hypothetical protein
VFDKVLVLNIVYFNDLVFKALKERFVKRNPQDADYMGDFCGLQGRFPTQSEHPTFPRY